MKVHLIDGTYELFRHFYGAPGHLDAEGKEVGAVRGVVASLVGLLRDGATHMGVATDHVVESFRNEMWPGYKRGDGIDPILLAQFSPLEAALGTLGITVWAMDRYEADDALASAAAQLVSDPRVERIYLCTPDKDLAQSVVGNRVVQLDRRARVVRDADGVRDKFGVGPESIPDYLALVGDTSDGYPGVRGWGAKSAAAVLGRYRFLEAVPTDPGEWDVAVRGAGRLAAALASQWQEALLFRDLAMLRIDAIRVDDSEALRWNGPTDEFAAWCERVGSVGLAEQVEHLRQSIKKQGPAAGGF